MALDSAAENASRKASAQQVLTRSRQRVSDHGEVFTPAWMTEAMLDLVKAESERIDSRFLESACGSGNFLVPVLQRKLAAVHLKYAKSDFEKHQHALLSLMCIYGVELLADNVEECRNSLLDTLANYLGVSPDDHIWRAARAVLELNIVHGDALTTTNTGASRLFLLNGSISGKANSNVETSITKRLPKSHPRTMLTSLMWSSVTPHISSTTGVVVERVPHPCTTIS